MTLTPVRRLALALLPALALGACFSFGAKPPPYLLKLAADSALANGATASGAAASAITVLTPEIPQKLSTPRVPVQATDTQVAYVEGAQWVDTPHRLFRTLLSETIAARTGRLVLDEGQGITDPGTRLAGTLTDFDVLAGSSAVQVTYDATLVRGETATKKRFQATAPLAAVDAQSVGVALNAAANQVAHDVADWVGR